jgi:hypothetical protein
MILRVYPKKSKSISFNHKNISREGITSTTIVSQDTLLPLYASNPMECDYDEEVGPADGDTTQYILPYLEIL